MSAETVAASAQPAPRTAEPATVSVRAAYQDLVHGRAVLLDVRRPEQRAAGLVGGGLTVVELGPVCRGEAGQRGRESRLVVMCADGRAAKGWADELGRDRQVGTVAAIAGGFAAWRAAGLPWSAAGGGRAPS